MWKNKFHKDELGSNSIFIWEFQVDITSKRQIEIRFYALDEIIGFVGGNLSIAILVFGYFVLPYS